MIFMDNLFKLVNERINKYLSNSPFVIAVPCVVTNVLADNMVTVQVVSNKTSLTVPNWSGSNVVVGESVQLFYKGNILSEQTAYVGASLTKASAQNYIQGSVIVGALFETERQLAIINFKNNAESVLLGFNATIQGDAENVGSGEFKIYVDEVEQSYSAAISTVIGGSTTCSFTVPLTLTSGEHEIVVSGSGDYTTVLKINSYVWGDVEADDPPFVPTTDNDYVYYTNSGEATTIYYTGSENYIITPTTLNDSPTTTFGVTTFNYSDVESVYIPDGLERIE